MSVFTLTSVGWQALSQRKAQSVKTGMDGLTHSGKRAYEVTSELNCGKLGKLIAYYRQKR